jgi:hypothetical protein
MTSPPPLILFYLDFHNFVSFAFPVHSSVPVPVTGTTQGQDLFMSLYTVSLKQNKTKQNNKKILSMFCLQYFIHVYEDRTLKPVDIILSKGEGDKEE